MSDDQYDVIVIGAGIAGTCAAHAVAAAGLRVVLIDTHAVYPRDFRAEKLGQEQMDQFDRLGLGSVARAATTRVDEVWACRFQRLVQTLPTPEYGLHYADLVNGLRAAIAVPVTVGRVAGIETGPDRQSVQLADGRRLEGRLVVLTTGLGDVLRRKVGIGKTVLSAAHSISFGFDLAAPPAAFPFPSVTCYGDAPDGRVAYGTLFPIRDTMRVNLFVYRDLKDPWLKEFRQSPEAMLRAALPWLDRTCRDLAVAGPVEMRPVDLVAAHDYRRDGVVLLGDAFLSPCPIPGTGIGKVLTDVERFATAHLPGWIATPGMARSKIDTFYDDAVKTAADERCVRSSLYARSITVAPGPAWTARRWRNAAIRHLAFGPHVLRRALPRFSGMGAAESAGGQPPP